jgi:hypothetical protein
MGYNLLYSTIAKVISVDDHKVWGAMHCIQKEDSNKKSVTEKHDGHCFLFLTCHTKNGAPLKHTTVH